MKLFRKVRKQNATVALGPTSVPCSETPKQELPHNQSRSAGQENQTWYPTSILDSRPAGKISVKQAVETGTVPQPDVIPSSSLQVESAAQRALNQSAEKLKEKIQRYGMGISEFNFEPIPGSYDMNSLAHNLEVCLGSIMDKANVAVSNQNVVKTFAKEWAKKSIPFIEKGLQSAEVPHGKVVA